MIKKLFFFLLLSIVSVSCFAQQDTVTLPNGQKLIPKNPNNYPSAVYNDSLKVITHNAVVNGKRVNLQLRAGDIKDAAISATASAIASKASTTDLSNLDLQLRSDLATKTDLATTTQAQKNGIVRSYSLPIGFNNDFQSRAITYFLPNLSTEGRYATDGWHRLNFYYFKAANTPTTLSEISTQQTVTITGLPDGGSTSYVGTSPTGYNMSTSVRNGSIIMVLIVNRQITNWYSAGQSDLIVNKAVEMLRDSLADARNSLVNKADASALSAESAARVSADDLINTSLGSKASSVDLSAEAAARVQMVSDSNNVTKVTQFAYPYYRMKDSLLPVIARTIQHTSNVLIYVDTLGNDLNDGLTRASAVLTVDRAMELINFRSGAGTWAYMYIYSSATNPVLFGTKYSSLQRNTYVLSGNTGATIKLINSQAEITTDKILFSTHATLLWRCNTVFDTARVTGFGLGVNGKMAFILNEMKFTKAGQILVQGAGSAFHNHSNEVSFEFYNINTQGISPIYFSKPMNNGNGLYNHNYKLDVNIKGNINPTLSLDMRYVNSIYYSANGLWTSEAISPTNDTYTKFVSKQSWEKPIDYTNNNAANYNIRSMTDKGYVDSVSRVKSKTLTLTTSGSTNTLDLENAISIDVTLTGTINADTYNLSFTNAREGARVSISFEQGLGTQGDNSVNFSSDFLKNDKSALGTYLIGTKMLDFVVKGGKLRATNL